MTMNDNDDVEVESLPGGGGTRCGKVWVCEGGQAVPREWLNHTGQCNP